MEVCFYQQCLYIHFKYSQIFLNRTFLVQYSVEDVSQSFYTGSSQSSKIPSISLNWTNGSLFLLPTPVYVLPLLPIPVYAPKCSSVESFLRNVDMKLPPKFPQCPSIGPMVVHSLILCLLSRTSIEYMFQNILTVPQLD